MQITDSTLANGDQGGRGGTNSTMHVKVMCHVLHQVQMLMDGINGGLIDYEARKSFLRSLPDLFCDVETIDGPDPTKDPTKQRAFQIAMDYIGAGKAYEAYEPYTKGRIEESIDSLADFFPGVEEDRATLVQDALSLSACKTNESKFVELLLATCRYSLQKY
jgi:hypothetical protein